MSAPTQESQKHRRQLQATHDERHPPPASARLFAPTLPLHRREGSGSGLNLKPFNNLHLLPSSRSVSQLGKWVTRQISPSLTARSQFRRYDWLFSCDTPTSGHSTPPVPPHPDPPPHLRPPLPTLPVTSVFCFCKDFCFFFFLTAWNQLQGAWITLISSWFKWVMFFYFIFFVLFVSFFTLLQIWTSPVSSQSIKPNYPHYKGPAFNTVKFILFRQTMLPFTEAKQATCGWFQILLFFFFFSTSVFFPFISNFGLHGATCHFRK